MELSKGTPRAMRIIVVGLRGLTGVQGGIETHSRMLYPLLARLGCDVEVVQRSPYYPAENRRRSWHGVRLRYLWSPTRRGIETAIHSLLGVLYAALARPDILHLHAIGPGLLAPLARLLGLKVVLTYHAPDYQRDKFSRLEKWLLRTGETLGIRFAHRPIAVSRSLCTDLQERFRREVAFIPNGAPRSLRAVSKRTLHEFGLESGRYVLCVGRLDPVKRHSDLIEAFERIDAGGWKLVLVGGFDARDNYSNLIAEHSERNPAIVMTGYQHGRALRELYSHAGLFVLASSTEGHPIALLEALSYGLPIIASAIPANMSVPIARNRYFAVGDVATLASKIAACIEEPERYRSAPLRDRILKDFSWRNAAQRTLEVYAEVANRCDPRWLEHRMKLWQKPS